MQPVESASLDVTISSACSWCKETESALSPASRPALAAVDLNVEADHLWCTACQRAGEDVTSAFEAFRQAKKKFQERWKKELVANPANHPPEALRLPIKKRRKKKGTLKTGAFQCHLCEKGFAAKRYLTDHLRRTHKAAAHACLSCEAAFASRRDLEQHWAREEACAPKDGVLISPSSSAGKENVSGR